MLRFVHMNRVDRLMAMVVQLQSRRLVRAEDLAHHFEISPRTVYRDLAALGEAGIPIVGEAGVGYSLVKGFHLPPVMFTAEEASALFLGSKVVSQKTDASLRQQMGSALTKIRSILPRDRQDYLDRLDEATAVLGAGSDPRQLSEALIPIQRALAERRVLRLEYKGSERDEITTRNVEPLGLVYYGENWHLVAHCRLRDDLREFRTDRMLAFEVTPEVFPRHENFSLKNYLQSCKEKRFDLVQVRFQERAMERVRREFHCGCIEERADGSATIVTLATCSSSDWLLGWLLSFRTQAQVLGPKHLRDQLAGEAQNIAAGYTEEYRPVPHALVAA